MKRIISLFLIFFLMTKSTFCSEYMINFRYSGEDLVDVINELAAKKRVNIILPQGPDPLAIKLTMQTDEALSLDQAWDLVKTILDIAGYSIIPKNNMFAIIKNSKETPQEPLPVFIGTDPSVLPNTDERIRYLYYLANIKVTEDDKGELKTILSQLLPKEETSYKTDPTTNAVIITAKSNDIRSIMKIIQELDKTGFQEELEVIPLRYSNAQKVADEIFKDLLKTTNELQRYRLGAKKKSEASYFAKNTKVIAEPRTNSLIVLGRNQAVDRIKDFIYKYIDVELESGKSVLHIYQLQYLDADKLKNVLENIISSTKAGGTGQTRAGLTAGGTQRAFSDIIIMADSSKDSEKYPGSNKLIVAAKNDDWKIIKKLIEELDIPQPQVLIEVLIADLSIDDIKLLGTSLRNPAKIPLPNGLDYQSAHVGQITLDPNSKDPETIQADLLRKIGSTDKSQAASMATGSTAISLNDNDGKTWSIAQLLKLFSHTKILSHPHVITTHNKQAIVTLGERRLLQDESVGSPGGTTTIKKKHEDANLTVKIKPRISGVYIEGKTRRTVDLEVDIDITEYIGSAIDTRATRKIVTRANVLSGEILALGGLIRVETSHSLNETPVLGKIPLLGWLFKSRQKDAKKNNLTVFISPTIIEPRLRSGVGEYTQEYIKKAKEYVQEAELFDTLKDPITRWFFSPGTDDATKTMDDFVAKDEFKRNIYQTASEKYDLETELKKNSIKKKNQTDMIQNAKKTFKESKIRKRQPFIQVVSEKNTESNKKNRGLTTKEIANKEITPEIAKKIEQIKSLIAHEENPLLSI